MEASMVAMRISETSVTTYTQRQKRQDHYLQSEWIFLSYILFARLTTFNLMTENTELYSVNKL
jgi:hypothetical protein